MKKVFIGWDGNLDEILDAVDTRQGPGKYVPMATMDVFGGRITAAAGKSCNIELVTKQQKVGGNGPILARALVEGGHAITLLGCFGEGKIKPLFREIEQLCERLITFAEPGYTQAVEFSDGKVLLGKLAPFDQITWENLLKLIPLPELIQIHEELDLFVSANWTMLLHVHGIWRGIIEQVMPKLSQKTRYMFVDLADPAKRTDGDVREALSLLSQLAKGYRLVLGLNASEGGRMARVLGLEEGDGSKEGSAQMAEGIREKVGAHMVLCHTTHYAVAGTADGQQMVDGPYTPKPKLTTGAGDNFNAGFCNGLLQGLPTRECLEMGCATSGFYVRNGRSPTAEELSQFLTLWHNAKV